MNNTSLLIIVAGLAVTGIIGLAAIGVRDTAGLQRIAELIITGVLSGGVGAGVAQHLQQRSADKARDAARRRFIGED